MKKQKKRSRREKKKKRGEQKEFGSTAAVLSEQRGLHARAFVSIPTDRIAIGLHR
jgi:hypothetical protein